MPISASILGFCLVAQGLLLALPTGARAYRIAELLSLLGFLSAAVALGFTHFQPAGLQPLWTTLLEDQPLFRLPRAAVFLAALLLGRNVVATRELPTGRKPEVLFLLTMIVFFCDLLLLSRHALLSSVLLAAISWIGVFLSGLAFRGRREGEATLKSWLQVSLSVAVGFGAALTLALVAGGLHYEVIAAEMRGLSAYSPESLLLTLALALPFFLAGGIFPFHFLFLDRDQGLPWSVQLLLDVIVQGVITLALWKMGVEVFGPAKGDQVADGLRLFQLAGLAGGFWLAVFAFSQENSKRLFAAIVGAQWSAILAAGAMPSTLGAAAVIYAFSSVFLWSALLGFVWSRLQEAAGNDEMKSVFGAARGFRFAGLMLILALTGPLCAPGFTGFPATFHLLGAMIEQKSLVFLVAEGMLLAVLTLSAFRVGTDLLFRPVAARINGESERNFGYGALDFGAMALLGATLLLLGLFWFEAFRSLNEAAKLFLR